MKVKRVDVMLCVSEEEADILYKEWNKEARSGDRNRLIDTGHSFIKYVNVNTIRFGDEEYQEFYLSPGVLRQGNHDEAIKLGMSLTQRSWNRFYYESKQTTNEDDYINIRIPKKGDVPIVTIEGRTFDSVSDEGLQSLKFVWVTQPFNLLEVPFIELKYIDQRINSTIRTQAIGDEYVAEKLRERVNE